MMLVEWDSTLVLGVKQIDEHHEKLVSILNECYRALMLNDHQHELEAIVSELRDYTHYHFGTEEKLMRELGYAEGASHLGAHEKFISSIRDFQERFKAGESFIAIDVLMFLKEWLVAHIRKSDKAFACFLKDKGIR